MRALSRLVLAALTALLVLAQSSVAFAQSDTPVPPVRSSTDENGVDVLSGKVIFTTRDLSIGPPDARGLKYERQWIERGWRPTLLPVLSGTSANPVITFDGTSVSFSFIGLNWEPDAKDGSKFSATSSSATFTSKDGLTIQFVTQDGYSYPDQISTWGHPTAVIFPNGLKWTFTYKGGMYTEAYVDPDCIKNCATQYYYYYWKRLSSVKSSAGYQLKLSYASNTLSTENDVGYWTRISRVTGINNAIESCDPAADSCSLTQPWPHVDYGYPTYGADATSMTDPAGQVWTFQYQSTRELIGILRPTSSAPAVTYGYTAYNGVGKVTAVTKGSDSWTYSYGTGTTTVTDPLSHTRLVTFDPSRLLISSDRNENGHTTQFTYCQTSDSNCPFERPKTVIFPDGDAVGFEYDTRGNVTKTTRSPKPGSGLSPLIVLSSFPSACSNQKTCNKPVSTTDARGAVTDFTYDNNHGGLLTITGPAATSGAPRPQVRYGYTAITNSVSGEPVYLMTSASTCRTLASCVGTADEAKSITGYSSSNLLATSRTSAAGDGSLMATVAMSYDNFGNLVTTDGPLPGMTDLTHNTYDALRRPVMEVGPDPDGPGPLSNRAARYGYDAQSRANSVAVGPSDSTGNNFTPAETRITSFDGADRKVRDTLTAGNTTYGVTQYGYDTVGRLQCMAQRMDPAQWSGQADACAAQTTGPNGPDRVSKQIYDAAGQTTGVYTAYGTADQTFEQASYTPNGQIATATDGNGNVTSFGYDGFDRLATTTFAGGSYEQLDYDANSNVISKRMRDGQVIGYGYDALNRLTSKDRPNSAYWETDQSYGYDLAGNLTSASDSNGRVLSFVYDALGRRTNQTDNWYGFGSAAYLYDAAGRRTRFTWGDGNYVSYDYLVTGEANTIRDSAGNALVSFGYNDLGRRTSLTRANGTVTSYAYDPALRLQQLTQDLAGTASDLSVTFGHNPADQITTRSGSNDGYAWTGHYNVDRSYGVNSLNQLTTAGTTNLGYDSRGNLTSSGSIAYGYTTDNQLATAPSVALAYDPLGRLFNGVIDPGVNTTLTYDGADIIAETDQNTGALLRRYVYGPGSDEPLIWYEGAGFADRRWLHADERGSVIAVTNDAGNAIAINRYDEYGIPQAGNIGRFQYTGQKWLPTLGLYDYKARAYSPTLGRFMQTDPIGYGDGLNWYNYVGGDPINATDPSGYTVQYCTGSIIPSSTGCGGGASPMTTIGGSWSCTNCGEGAQSDGADGLVVNAPNWIFVPSQAVAATNVGYYLKFLGRGLGTVVDFALEEVFNPSPAGEPKEAIDNIVNKEKAKAKSPVWKALKGYRGQTKTDGKKFYEWDYTHGDIEVYNKRGIHLGSMDAFSGEMIKPAEDRKLKL